MNVNRLWIAALVSGRIHCAVLAAAVIVALMPSYAPPTLIEAYGDSDRAGFPIATVAVNPGAWQEGDADTPGGDGEAPEPLIDDRPSEPTPAAAEAAMALAATSAPERREAPKQPGAPGGAQMAIGTPSAGGKVGSRNGIRMLDAEAKPAYPEAARQAGIEGRPVYRLRISSEGTVLEVKLVKSSGHKVLDDAGLRWLQTRRFWPAYSGNTPVEAETPWAINFYLY